MPTNTARSTAIVDAALNKASTAAQRNRFGLAIANQAIGINYAAMTADQKAGLLVQGVRRYLVEAVKQLDAQDATSAAVTSATTAVDTEFAEA